MTETAPTPEPASPEGPGEDGPATMGPGAVIAESYRLREALPAGGMGRAFLADDLSDGPGAEASSAWVVKLLEPGLLDGDFAEHRRRFLSSAALQARLSLPGVANVRGYGRCGEGAYMAMPYDPGRRPLRAVLQERPDGRMPWREALGLLRELAVILDRLHRRKVIHRDLKPDNILVVDPGSRGEEADAGFDPQLIDFGIAKDLGAEASLTATGSSPGFSPDFGAPELLRSSGDARSDLFSYGVTALELLSGRRLHGKGPNDFDGVRVPRGLNRLVRALTDTDPQARPASAAAVLVALDAIEKPRWPARLLVAGAVIILGLALWLGKRELDRRELDERALNVRLINLEAELTEARRALEAARKAPKPPPAPKDPAPTKLDPRLKSLEAYRALAEADAKVWAEAPPRELIEKRRELWADLKQVARGEAVREAAGARVLAYDAVALRRGYALRLLRIIKPFDPGEGRLYLDWGVKDGEPQRLEDPKLERVEGIATLSFAAEAPRYLAEIAGRVTLSLALYEARSFYRFDRSVLTEDLELIVPPELKLMADGAELELRGKDGLRVLVELRRR